MKNSENNLTTIEKLPNLHEAKTSPRELSSTYWTPEIEGEYKVGVAIEIKEETYENESGEKVELPCIVMLAQEEDGSFSTIRNGSKRLVATIENAVESGEIVLGKTPIKISFIGKQKNKTNSYQSDRWSVKPIIL
jgi:ribosomal protein L21